MIRVFYGDDTFRSREAYLSAREEAAAEAGVPATILRDEPLRPEALQAAVEAQSLFASALPPVACERLTVFTGADAEAVARVLLSVPAERTLLVWEEGSPNPQGIVWRALKKTGDLEEFRPLGGDDLSAWVEQRLAGTRRTIEPPALEALLAACGMDLWALSSEIAKLALARSRGPITAADVAELVPAASEADIFATVRALVAGDRSTAFRLLAAHRRLGTDPRRVLSLVVRELRMLLHIREALDRGERPAGWQLSRELHLPRFVVEQLLRTARGTTASALGALFARCVVSYYHLNTGRADAAEVLDRLALARGVPAARA